jgi:hypothetical protein
VGSITDFGEEFKFKFIQLGIGHEITVAMISGFGKHVEFAASASEGSSTAYCIVLRTGITEDAIEYTRTLVRNLM